jgi:hypothetical protein
VSSGNFESRNFNVCPHPLGYRSCLHNVGILSRQFEGTESEKPNGHQSGNMGEKTETVTRYMKRSRSRTYSDDEFLVHSRCTITCKCGHCSATESSVNY